MRTLNYYSVGLLATTLNYYSVGLPALKQQRWVDHGLLQLLVSADYFSSSTAVSYCRCGFACFTSHSILCVHAYTLMYVSSCGSNHGLVITRCPRLAPSTFHIMSILQSTAEEIRTIIVWLMILWNFLLTSSILLVDIHKLARCHAHATAAVYTSQCRHTCR